MAPKRPGIKTTELWLALVYLALAAVISVFGLDFDALAAALPVVGYQVARGAAKLIPPFDPLPPPPPPPLAAEESGT